MQAPTITGQSATVYANRGKTIRRRILTGILRNKFLKVVSPVYVEEKNSSLFVIDQYCIDTMVRICLNLAQAPWKRGRADKTSNRIGDW